MEWTMLWVGGVVTVMVALALYALWQYDRLKWVKLQEEMEQRVEEAIEKYEAKQK